jgi:hypothetical protein
MSVRATDRLVFVESMSRVAARDLGAGAARRPFVVGDTLLLVTARRVEAFDTVGRRLWVADGFRRLVKAEPAVAGGRLFIAG